MVLILKVHLFIKFLSDEPTDLAKPKRKDNGEGYSSCPFDGGEIVDEASDIALQEEEVEDENRYRAQDCRIYSRDARVFVSHGFILVNGAMDAHRPASLVAASTS